MAGTCVHALAEELRSQGQHKLAARVVHAADHDEHTEYHRSGFVDGCICCHAEVDDRPARAGIGGNIHEKLRL